MSLADFNPRADLLERIARYCAAQQLSPDKFGRLAVKNHHFIKRLRTGYGVTLRTIERAEAFMDATP